MQIKHFSDTHLGDNDSDILDENNTNPKETNIEDISLEDAFLEHIKLYSDDIEYERLQKKVQELFCAYAEVSNDTM